MNQQFDIYKAGGVIIRDRHFLVTRSMGKSFFIAPGGKLEGAETPVEALKREMKEEVQIDIKIETLKALGTFYAEAAGKDGVRLRMDVFIINDYDGEPIPSSEIEEIRWINTQTKNTEIGSIFKHDVMPLLKQMHLID